MASDPKPYLTVEQYLQLESTSVDGSRNEYEDGYLFPILAASPNHARITANLFHHTTNALRQKVSGCRAYAKDAQVKAGPRWAYPDLVVACGKEEWSHLNKDMALLLNPVLIGEVLSSSTQDFDRGSKFERYRSISSFREYLIVYQDRLLVEQHIRQPNGDWLMRSHSDALGSVMLDSIGVQIELSNLYDGVTWPE